MVEISGHIVHILAVGGGAVVGIGIAEAGSDWLVHEEDVVVDCPGVVVPHYLPGSHVGRFDKIGSQLHKIAKLTGGSGPSVEPDDGGHIFELVLAESFLAIEDEGEAGTSLVDAEVPAVDNSGVVVGRDAQIDRVAFGFNFDVIIVAFGGKDAVFDIDALLLEEGGGVEGVGDYAGSDE